MRRFLILLSAALLFACIASLDAQTTIKITFGESAQDFPPGPFTDGNQYKMDDFKGKVVVLYFFDGNAPTVKKKVGQRAAIAAALRGKPVKFFGVAGNTPLPAAQAYQGGLGMPVFVDSLGLMQARYGFQLSLKLAEQVRVVGASGKIEEAEVFDMSKGDIDKAIERNAGFKYDPKEFDAKMAPALEMLEYGQWGPAVRALGPFTRSGKKATAEAAKKFIAEIKSDAEKWKSEADDLVFIEPVKAYDLYKKAAAAVPNEEVGKAASAAANKLTSEKAVAAELSARKAYTGLIQSMGQTFVAGKPAIMQSCKTLVKKHQGTPTADKIDDIYRELGGMEPARKAPVAKEKEKN